MPCHEPAPGLQARRQSRQQVAQQLRDRHHPGADARHHPEREREPSCSPARRWSATTGSRPCRASRCAAAAIDVVRAAGDDAGHLGVRVRQRQQRSSMFAGNATKLYDVTTVHASRWSRRARPPAITPPRSWPTPGGDWLIAVNDAGDPPLRYRRHDVDDAERQPDPTLTRRRRRPPTLSRTARNLVYVCKYRNRFFFIERNSMNAWYLPLNAVGGALLHDPAVGRRHQGRQAAVLRHVVDRRRRRHRRQAGVLTDLGELLIFTGSDPSSAANWRQEGRYTMSPPLGMNAHLAIGGDLLIATVDGIVPMSARDHQGPRRARAGRDHAAPSSRCGASEVIDKREQPWTMCKWDEYGGIFATLPGGAARQAHTASSPTPRPARGRASPAGTRCASSRMRGDMFFGTQTGHHHAGRPHRLRRRRALRRARWSAAGRCFSRHRRPSRGGRRAPRSPPAPASRSCRSCRHHRLRRDAAAAADRPGRIPACSISGTRGCGTTRTGTRAPPPSAVVRNTGWVSIGMTGFSHAPIVQVTVAQQAKPVVDLISIAGAFERLAVTV